LQSGKKYVAIGPDPQMSNKSFECYANSFAEIVTISEKIGTFGTLTINGVDYPNRYISGLDNIFEIWEGTDHWTFSIQFDRADVY
jgi:hypothetical protein